MYDSSWSISVIFISGSLPCALMAPSRHHDPWLHLIPMSMIVACVTDCIELGPYFCICEFLHPSQTITQMSQAIFLAFFNKKTCCQSFVFVQCVCTLNLWRMPEAFKIGVYSIAYAIWTSLSVSREQRPHTSVYSKHITQLLAVNKCSWMSRLIWWARGWILYLSRTENHTFKVQLSVSLVSGFDLIWRQFLCYVPVLVSHQSRDSNN